jgi:prepilin-type N-terminal cleavage/methylation domain-containing protein/prepilin-type processing-associated H-X9-DG protein
MLRRCKSAFTLVELLIVIAIIGVLVALLLPAVQAAREASRRIQCASQIKQLALATLQYEGVHKRLPPSGLAQVRQEDPFKEDIIFDPYGGIPQFSWVILLLPHLEQAALASQFDDSRQVFFQKNNPQNVRLASLVCPSDDLNSSSLQLAEGFGVTKFAKGNYAAFCSPFHVDLQLLYRGAFIAGGQPMAAITDGTSNTLALAEVRTLNHDSDSRGAWALPRPGATLLAFDMHPVGWPTEHDGTARGDDYHVELDARYEASPESVGETMPPNTQGPNADTIKLCNEGLQREAAAAEMPCTIDRPPGLNGYMSAAPRSRHPGGVNAAYLDGHVSFLVDGIDEFSMAFAVSINDGTAGK